jgi:glycosyltransferase involved in cell wall biosynthesis
MPAAIGVVSVLVGARDASEDLRVCLRSLEREAAPENVEVIVAVPESDPGCQVVDEEFPWAELITVSAERGANLAELRAAAYVWARGEIIAFTDAHCSVAPGWIEAIRRAIGAGADVAAGAVLNGTPGSISDWTAFLFDYGDFLPPIAAGPATTLSGNNIAYRREMLGEPESYARGGLLKYFVNLRLAREGCRMVTAPEMVVSYRRRIPLARLLRDRFHFGRCFAAQRLAEAGVAFRFWYRVLAPLLPALVVARVFRRLLARPVLRRQTVRAALPLALVGLAWGVGETAGALLGRGTSCREVY